MGCLTERFCTPFFCPHTADVLDKYYQKNTYTMNQIFRTLQNVLGRRAYTPAELTVTEFLAEQGFALTDIDEPPDTGGGGDPGDWGDDWGDPGNDEGPEPGGDGH